ncbi:MAG TPA: YkvA family protein [Leptolyngbyaceae cyanobacterium]
MKNLAQSFYDWYTQTLRHPKYRWVLVAGTLVYLLSPIDISPDFLPIIGWIDDGVVATLLVAELSQILMNVLSGRDRKSESPVGDADSTVIEVKPQ